MEVAEVRQSFLWDCGLACTEMVVRTFFQHNMQTVPECSVEILHNMADTESVWGVDIAYLLKRFDVPCVFCTTSWGVKKEYAQMAFYKNTFDQDQNRVNTLFEQAERNGVCIQVRSVSSEEIKNHVSRGNLVVALVNANLLEAASVSEDVPYHGHFVLVCGFEETTDEWIYKDPDTEQRESRATQEQFDKARKSVGTDEDLIFVFLTLQCDKVY